MGMSNYQDLTDRSIALINDGRWDEAFDELKRKEAENDRDAIAVLAQFYLYGVGIAKDIEMALELFNRAISLGSPDAAWELGLLYHHNDEVVPVNKYKAVELFEKGAQGGNESCYGVLSECYLRGDGTSVDEKKAFEYALMAAKAGNSMGMLNAAICYDDGLGTNPDTYAASHWYKEYLNYSPDDDFAMLRIALCMADPYERYVIRATGDALNEAFYYASKAVEKGNVEAHLIVGWFYEKGEIVPQDFDLAHKYIEIAANHGNEAAQKHLQDFRKNIYGNYYIPGF
jgi:FOG: TPR repeat, SEL1 subfamily